VFAQYDLGVSYDNRLDYKEAVKWYRLSAEQGYARAQSNLGAMYNNGQGVPRDLMYAYMWSYIAASLGDTNAAKNRDDDAHRMTPSQLEKAQDLSRKCVQKNYKGC
jgi:TPR repeat protein